MDPLLVEPSVFRDNPIGLVVAPDAELPIGLVTSDQRLYTLGRNGQWLRSQSKVIDATYGE